VWLLPDWVSRCSCPWATECRYVHTGAVGATNMNAHSSRSHAIFTVTIECSDKGPDGKQRVRAGKLHLVDLAVSTVTCSSLVSILPRLCVHCNLVWCPYYWHIRSIYVSEHSFFCTYHITVFWRWFYELICYEYTDSGCFKGHGGPKFVKMADFKVCLLQLYACNQ